jgi:hypothetical protein
MRYNPKKSPSGRKRFKYWDQLLFDILIDGFTISDASKKYLIPKATIQKHLNRRPFFKKVYYRKPWASEEASRRPEQLKFDWTSPDCREFREELQIAADISQAPAWLYIFETLSEHRINCLSCREFIIDMQIKRGLFYRLDCPPLEKLELFNRCRNDYLEPKLENCTFGCGDPLMCLIRHFLYCTPCLYELYFLSKISDFRANMLIITDGACYAPATQEKQEHSTSWRNFFVNRPPKIFQQVLNIIEEARSLDRDPLQLIESESAERPFPHEGVYKYFCWRDFRARIDIEYIEADVIKQYPWRSFEEIHRRQLSDTDEPYFI